MYAGTVLLAGSLRARVTSVGTNTMVGRWIQRVEEAQELRAPIQTVGVRFSTRFVPMSFILAAGVFVLTEMCAGLSRCSSLPAPVQLAWPLPPPCALLSATAPGAGY